MSVWSHVAGIIRIDAFRALDGGATKEYFDKVFGKEVHYDGDDIEWKNADEHPEEYLPMGSEGSLSMSVWINPNPRHFAAYTVSIFGDLRDHYDPQGIIDWFESKCRNLNVRNATITVENPLCGTLNWTYAEAD